MDQHPVPRQITTFEFKLIGFLTLKQFLYLLVFVPTGFIVFKLFPVPLLNILLGILVGAVGAAFAFLPINDRPLDVWIKNFFKRITSPTQYIYQKENKALVFLKELFFVDDPHRTLSHVESQEKLAGYLSKNRVRDESGVKKQTIHNLFFTQPSPSPAPVIPDQPVAAAPVPLAAAPPTSVSLPSSPQITQTAQKQPLFTGIIKNHKLIPLPGILIYVKDQNGEVKRLLKTNPHGVFATFSLLPAGEYIFEMKDPKNTYFFDTMKIQILETNPKPIEIYSKELL